MAPKYFKVVNKKIPYNYNKFCAKCVEGLKFHPEGRYPETTCIKCDNYRVVDEEGWCQDCRESDYHNVENCLECGAYFPPLEAGQLLCRDCTPKCSTCSKSFNPSTRTETLCASCNFKARRGTGECSSCGDESNELDSNARCIACSAREFMEQGHQDHWCSVCKDTRVGFPNVPCKSCSEKKVKCKDCYARIPATDYLCAKCYGRRKNKFTV